MYIFVVMLFQEDDEHTIEEDEALITKEERQEELAALHNEIDLPLEELLKRYAAEECKSFLCLLYCGELPFPNYPGQYKYVLLGGYSELSKRKIMSTRFTFILAEINITVLD